MKTWGVLIALSLAYFIIVIDTTIMNVSISVLITDLDTTVTGIQSAISIYAMVMASMMLIGGRLSDVMGSKRTFITGLVIYCSGTILASFAQGLSVLILGWSVLEGIGAALMIPTLQVLLRSQYSGARLALCYGIISAVSAIGAALGPIVGGFFTTYISWRWAFRSELFVAFFIFLLSPRLKPDEKNVVRPKFDYLGSVMSIAGWSCIVLGTLLSQKYGFFLAKEPLQIGSRDIAPLGLSASLVIIALGIVIIMLFFRYESYLESKNKDGLFKPSVFFTPSYKPGVAVRFSQLAITSGFLYIMPLLLQLTFDYTAMKTGLALMPFSLSLLITAVIGAKFSARFFANHIIITGLGLAILGLVSIGASIQPDITSSELVLGSLFGVGIGLIASQLLNLILSAVRPEQTAEAAGLNSTFEQLGNAIGVALVGTVMMSVLTSNIIQDINVSPGFSQIEKTQLSSRVEQSMQLLSDSQLTEVLDSLGADQSEINELTQIYANSRIDAFRAAVALLIFFSVMALLISLWLPKRKLISSKSVP